MIVGTNDLGLAMAFYDAVMPTLGYSRQDTGETYLGYGKPEDIGSGVNCLFVSKPFDGAPATRVMAPTSHCLRPQDQKWIVFHELGLISGAAAKDLQGCVTCTLTFMQLYLRDPCGNKLAVVCHKAVEGE